MLDEQGYILEEHGNMPANSVICWWSVNGRYFMVEEYCRREE